MSIQHKYRDYTSSVDDTKGCYAEVKMAGLKAYAGVDLANGTNDHPYAFTPNEQRVTDDGISRGSGGYPTPDAALEAAFNHLIGEFERNQAHQAFDQKKACENLHDFLKGWSQ